MNCLIVVPHADDELIGCYQIIKLLRRNVRLFYCGYTGYDDSNKNKKTRLAEFIKFAESEKLTYHVSHNNVYEDLKKVISEYKPNTIFLPSYVDWHWQHRECNTICLKILEELKFSPDIAWYQISIPLPYSLINYRVTMDKSLQNIKWKVFRNIYKSQKNLPCLRFKIIERINGKPFDSYAAEVFLIKSYDKWKQMMDFLIRKHRILDFNNMENMVNNLTEISNIVGLIWSGIV